MRTKGERWDLAHSTRFEADEWMENGRAGWADLGGGLGTVSISKGSDGLPWLSRNGQGHRTSCLFVGAQSCATLNLIQNPLGGSTD